MNPIDVFDLSRTGAQWDGSVPLAALPRLRASLLAEAGGPATALRFACDSGPDSQGRPALRLQLHAVLPLRCDRCGAALHFALASHSSFYFVETEAQLAAIAIDDTPEEALLGSRHFDLAELIEDEAILQLPISPRHDRCPPAAVAAGRTAAPAPAPAPGAQRPHPFATLAGLRERLQNAPEGAPAAPAEGATAVPKASPDPQGRKRRRGGA